MILQGKSEEILKELESNSVDSVVTDPPYELGFMGKKWDSTGIAYNVDLWKEVFRVLKPGGHLLSFGGSRTYHRMAVAIEDAGFEIRDQIMWVYGNGFPKNHDISKGIDKKFGAEREITGDYLYPDGGSRKAGAVSRKGSFKNAVVQPLNRHIINPKRTAPATEQAKQWDGWGTALKPAHEPIVLARKPLSEKTIVDNVLKHGTGGINIDESRIGTETIKHNQDRKSFQKWKEQDGREKIIVKNPEPTFHQGRWPANLIHDGREEVLKGFPEVQNGGKKNAIRQTKGMNLVNDSGIYGKYNPQEITEIYGGDSGSAARFFYCAKASKAERNAGLQGMEERPAGSLNMRTDNHSIKHNQNTASRQNNHPTVKPLKLMSYLVKLITPPGGTVLDPFCGSGTTGMACKENGFKFIGIEKEVEYVEIATKRIEAIQENLFTIEK